MVKVDAEDSTGEALPYSAQASRLSGFQEALPHIKDASYDLFSLSSGTQINAPWFRNRQYDRKWGPGIHCLVRDEQKVHSLFRVHTQKLSACHI